MKKTLYTVFLVCAAVVIGSLISNFTADISFLSWLSYGLKLGISSPLVLDLGVISITFAATFNLTVSVIICLVISLCIGRLLKPW